MILSAVVEAILKELEYQHLAVQRDDRGMTPIHMAFYGTIIPADEEDRVYDYCYDRSKWLFQVIS